MSGSVNRVILVGALGRDPDTKTFNDGGKIVNLSVATSRRWNDKQTGERKAETHWHRVAITNKPAAEAAEQYARKGQKVYVEGSIQYREYTDRDGNKRHVTEIVVAPFDGRFEILSPKKDDNRPAERPRDARGRQESSDLSDDVPF